MLGLVEFAPGPAPAAAHRIGGRPLRPSQHRRHRPRRRGGHGASSTPCTPSTEPTSALPIFLIAAVFGTARAFVSPANRSIPPLVAPDGGLPRVMAVYAATWQIGLIIGPASSGWLYDRRPDRWPFVVAAACFAVAAVAVFVTLATRRHQIRTGPPSARSLHHALEGLRFIRHRPILLGRDRPRPVRRAVRRGGRPAPGDRRGPARRRRRRLRMAARRTRASVPLIFAVGARRSADPPPRRSPTAPRGGHLRRRHGRARADPQLRRRVRRAASCCPAPTRSACSSARPSCRWPRPTRCAAACSAVENVFVGASNEVGAFESGVASALIGVGPAVVLGGVLTLGVVGVWSVVFPALRDIDRFEDVTVDPVPAGPSRARRRDVCFTRGGPAAGAARLSWSAVPGRSGRAPAPKEEEPPCAASSRSSRTSSTGAT